LKTPYQLPARGNTQPIVMVCLN